MNNTGGSYCLAGSRTKKEASLIIRLRAAGAIILGKANMSQWGNARSSERERQMAGALGVAKHTVCITLYRIPVGVAADLQFQWPWASLLRQLAPR
jgi:hypothetical protein